MNRGVAEPELAKSPPPISELTIWTIPNVITMVRLVLSFVVFALISAGNLWITSAVVFVIAVATDYFDGYLARLWNQKTVLGRILDPFVDKIIVCGSFLFLQDVPASHICAWFNIILISREMFITSLRGFLEQRGIDFKAEWSGKIKMALQSVAVPVCLLACDELLQGQTWLVMLQKGLIYGVVIVTVYSGLEYIVRAAIALRKADLTKSM